MYTKFDREAARQKRHRRVRRRVWGSSERPRLAVHRSLRHISVQIVNDERGHTLVSASSEEKSLRTAGNTAGRSAAEAVGKLVAERAVEQGITQVVFDRGGYLYHGRIAALADAARQNGLRF